MSYPTSFVTKITVICEKVLQPELDNKNWFCKKYLFDYITFKIINTFVSFKTMHSYELLTIIKN